MSRFFRSQCGEDKWLSRNWGKIGLPDVGYFVEFGAGDGVHFSNTYWLEKVKRWNGLLIEADPRTEIKGRSAAVDRRVVGPAGFVSFGLHPTDGYLSGVKRDAPERIAVQSVPLSDILAEHGVEAVDLVSIDVEGTELEAWRTLDLKRWRPRIAIIELVTWQISDRSAEIIDAMKADGYELAYKTELNGIFCDRFDRFSPAN